MHEIAIIGGGPAGLQAALTAGRMHRRTVLIDSGRYRNAPVRHMQNLVGFDGADPADLRAAARAELAAYGSVETRNAEVARIEGTRGAFTLVLADGERIAASRVILATGVTDGLPDIPGLAALFGTAAAHCPFCHGHEFAGTRVGLVGMGAHAPRMAAMLRPIAAELVVLAHGEDVDAATADQLARLGATIREDRIASFAAAGDGALATFADGATLELGGVLTATAWRQSTPFAEHLGLALHPSGAVEVDALGRTSVPGVSAAGDAAVGSGLPGPMHAVGLSIAAGLTAAAAVVQDLVAEELAG